MPSTTRLLILFLAVVFIPGALRSETRGERKAIYDEKAYARVEITSAMKDEMAVVKRSLDAYAEKVLGAQR